MVYQFKNKECPKCGKLIDPYFYVMMNGVKYHMECKPDDNVL